MKCDPSSLMQSARCLECIPTGMQAGVRSYLLCQWANAEVEPCVIHWTPEATVIAWQDSAGAHAGNLAAFLATPTWPSTTILNLIGLGLTELSCLQSLPLLTALNANNNNFTSIDASGLIHLHSLFCNTNPALSSLIVSGCIALSEVGCNQCNLSSLDFTGCNQMAGLDCSSNVLTDLRIGDSTLWGSAMVGIQANNNLLAANPPGPAEGIDDILHRLAIAPFPLGNPDSLDLDTPATNASPTGGIANPDYVALVGAGWLVFIN